MSVFSKPASIPAQAFFPLQSLAYRPLDDLALLRTQLDLETLGNLADPEHVFVVCSGSPPTESSSSSTRKVCPVIQDSRYRTPPPLLHLSLYGHIQPDDLFIRASPLERKPDGLAFWLGPAPDTVSQMEWVDALAALTRLVELIPGEPDVSQFLSPADHPRTIRFTAIHSRLNMSVSKFTSPLVLTFTQHVCLRCPFRSSLVTRCTLPAQAAHPFTSRMSPISPYVVSSAWFSTFATMSTLKATTLFHSPKSPTCISWTDWPVP